MTELYYAVYPHGGYGIIPAFAAGLFGIIYGIVQFVIMGNFFDRLFRKKRAQRLVASSAAISVD